MTNPKKFWDGMAEKYATSPIADENAYQASLERTKSYLKPADHVLELGCGTGSTAMLLADDVASITASDVSPNMVSIGERKAAERNIQNVNFVAADLFNLNIAAGPYDTVMAFNLLHLIEDVPAAVRQLSGMVKPGGLFISKTTCLKGAALPMKYRLMMMALPLVQLMGKAPLVNKMTIADLESAIISGGFKIIETGNYPETPPNHYVVAEKI
ncbi:MAG: class I SAM-dependent methyltransferase [Salaquimonas sp.]